MIYRKLPAIFSGVGYVFGKGIVFAEGMAWKSKRKFLTKKFNFDFVIKNLEGMDFSIS